MTRFTRLLVPTLVALGSLTAACGDENPYEATKSAEVAPIDTEVNDGTSEGDGLDDNVFIPETKNLSDCVGTVERPGCGSKSKGGLHMFLVFTAIILGLSVIGWRLSLAIRRRDAVANAAPVEDSGWAQQS